MTAGHPTIIRNRLQDYLKQNHIRRSDSRDAVLQLLLETHEHMELSSLMRQAKERGVGEATVFRALRVFQEAGLVSRIENSHGQVSYEIPREHHDHMICTRCGTVIEFHSETIEKAQERVAQQNGFVITYHHHEMFGTCAKCNRGSARLGTEPR